MQHRKSLLAGMTLAATAALVACGPPPDPPEPPLMCDEPGYICTLAGTGISGLGDDGLPPAETDLYLPMDVQLGPDGTLYLSDWNNHRIRRVQDGVIDTLIGTGYLGDAPDGPAEGIGLNHPVHMSFAPTGQLIIAAWHNSKVLRYDFGADTITTICGTGARSFGGDGGPASEAVLDLPVATAFAPDGRMYIADQANQRIRMVDLEDNIDTVVGTGERGFGGDGGLASEAMIDLPTGQSAPPSGRITTDADGNLFIADTGNHRIRKVDTDGIITTLAGTGDRGFAGDGGASTGAQLNRPNDVAVDDEGNVYIADTDNHCVRKVDTAGVLTTIAGTCGERGDEGDNGLAVDALLNRPYGVEVASNDGILYVVDTHNHRIRSVALP